jgi:hypothetical protein
MTEKFVSEPIKYLRYKSCFSDKIISENGYKVKRTTTTKGYDSLLGKWSICDKSSKLLPLSEIGCFKELTQTIYIKKTNVNPSTLENMELWLKRVLKIEVINKESNVYLTMACNRIFVNDVVRGLCVPLQQNGCPQNLKITKVSEAPLSQIELQKLNEDLKLLIKPVICEELANGEIRLLC